MKEASGPKGGREGARREEGRGREGRRGNVRDSWERQGGRREQNGL